MNNSAAKVGEIFREAGTAFTKLSEMTLMLQPTDDATPGSKWSEEEVEMLRGCVNRFAVELNKISQHIKNRTMSYLRHLLEMDTGKIYDVNQSPPHRHQLLPLAQQEPLTLQPVQEQKFILQSLSDQNIILQPLQGQLLVLQQDPTILQQLQPKQQNSQPLHKQPKHSFQLKQQPQIIPESPQANIILETETQFEKLFPDHNEYKKGGDDIADLLRFNPGIVSQTPPDNIMQEDKIPQQPTSEFDDTEDNSEALIRMVIPHLIHLLDLEFYRFIHVVDPNDRKRYVGTLHAEIPEYNPKSGTGAFSNIRNEGLNNKINMVTKKEYFTWSRATRTWEHANPPAVNDIQNKEPIGSEKAVDILPTSNENINIITNHNTPQLNNDPVPGAFSSIFNQNNTPIRGVQAQTGGSLAYNGVGYAGSELKPKNISLFSSLSNNHFLNDDSFNGAQVETSSLLAWDDPLFQFNDSEKKPKIQKKDASPGPFSSLLSKICSKESPWTQAQSYEQKCSDLSGNSFYSSNPEPITSVQGLSETTLQSSSHRTRGSKGRGISRRRSGCELYAARTSAFISSAMTTTLAENMTGPTNDQTRLLGKRANNCIDFEKPIPKKRKKATFVTTPGPVTRSQSKKQSQ